MMNVLTSLQDKNVYGGYFLYHLNEGDAPLVTLGFVVSIFKKIIFYAKTMVKIFHLVQLYNVNFFFSINTSVTKSDGLVVPVVVDLG